MARIRSYLALPFRWVADRLDPKPALADELEISTFGTEIEINFGGEYGYATPLSIGEAMNIAQALDACIERAADNKHRRLAFESN